MYLKIALVLYRIVKTERQTKSGYGMKRVLYGYQEGIRSPAGGRIPSFCLYALRLGGFL